jgi:hypothetical protein
MPLRGINGNGIACPRRLSPGADFPADYSGPSVLRSAITIATPEGESIMTVTRKAARPARKSTKGVTGVEIKVTIQPDQELRALRSLELNEDTAEIRVIYFYDTVELDLTDAGVVLRARLTKGDADDSTIKIRPVDPARIPPRWSKLDGFKIEADQTGNRIVCSASLTAPQKRDEIDEAAKGKRPVGKLFSKEQSLFLSELYPQQVDFERLQPLGPIRVLCWKTRHKNFPYALTAEEWRLPDGDDLIEVSIKVAPGEAAKAQRAFESHLRTLGLDPAGAQQTKTRTALEYFARALKSTRKKSTAKKSN